MKHNKTQPQKLFFIQLFSFFTLLLVIFQVNAYSSFSISQDYSYACRSNNIKLNITSNETFHIGSLKLASEDLAIGAVTENQFFFNDENRYRFDRDYLEFFDITPNSKDAAVTLELVNRTGYKAKIKPGKYTLHFIPKFQKKDDSYIDVPEFNATYDIMEDLELIYANITGRKNKTNTAVMGEDISVTFYNNYSEFLPGVITASIIYDGMTYDRKEFEINETSGTFFKDAFNTITEPDQRDTTTCPDEDIIFEVSNACHGKELYVTQEVPQPSDIYFYVDRFFDYGEARIPQIYYMVGAYFNCGRSV
jgi:hypothetical protein